MKKFLLFTLFLFDFGSMLQAQLLGSSEKK